MKHCRIYYSNIHIKEISTFKFEVKNSIEKIKTDRSTPLMMLREGRGIISGDRTILQQSEKLESDSRTSPKKRLLKKLLETSPTWTAYPMLHKGVNRGYANSLRIRPLTKASIAIKIFTFLNLWYKVKPQVCRLLPSGVGFLRSTRPVGNNRYTPR